jgi:hypothetical protein
VKDIPALVAVSLFLLMALPGPIKGDWDYPGYEDIEWCDSGDIYFTYNFEVHCHSKGNDTYWKVSAEPADFYISDSEKYLAIMEHYLPSDTIPPMGHDYPLRFFLRDLSTGKTVLELTNVTGCSISSDDSRMLVLDENVLEIYDLKEMRIVGAKDIGKRNRFTHDDVTWAGDGYIAISADYHNLVIYRLDDLEVEKNITGSDMRFGFSPLGKYLHVYEDAYGMPISVWETNGWNKVFTREGASIPDDPWGPGEKSFVYRTHDSEEPHVYDVTYHIVSTVNWTETGFINVIERSFPTLLWNDDKTMIMFLERGDWDHYSLIPIYNYSGLELLKTLKTDLVIKTAAFSPYDGHIAVPSGGPYDDSLELTIMNIPYHEGDMLEVNAAPWIFVPGLLFVTILVMISMQRKR